MLIDIFARRYEKYRLRDSFEQRDGRLLVQAFRILSEDFFPYYIGGKEDAAAVTLWTNLHSRLSRELGLRELSARYFVNTTMWNGNQTSQTHSWSLVKVCENWLVSPAEGVADEHIKERLSLIELGFRERESAIVAMNAKPIEGPDRKPYPGAIGRHLPQTFGEQMQQLRAASTAAFRSSVDELNARFRQAAYPLHYHNGYIQLSTDEAIKSTIEEPFWKLVAGAPWTNVDTDMKEALDLRDSSGRDPAFYAARALESTIKIISDLKGWTTGKEGGAHNYIENLASRKHGLIKVWESKSLKDFFSDIRNPFGHGAGSAEMPSLSQPQTEWAIEFSMSWIKSLIRRL